MITKIPNGFRGILRDDGGAVLYGFNRVVTMDLSTGLETPHDVGGECSGCGWHDGQPVISKYQPWGRELINGPMTPPATQYPGVHPLKAVANGTVVSSWGGVHYLNSLPVTDYDAHLGTIEDFDGHHYLYKPHLGDPWPLVVRNLDGEEVFVITAPVTNAVVWTNQYGQPWVLANLIDHAVLYGPEDSVTHFQSGEMRGCCVAGPDGSQWCLTTGIYANGTPGIFWREMNELTGPAIIQRGVWWADLDAKWKPAEMRWVDCGYVSSGHPTLAPGILFVDDAVDPSQPKEVVNLADSTPAPIDPPIEPPLPQNPHIISFTVPEPLVSNTTYQIQINVKVSE